MFKEIDIKRFGLFEDFKWSPQLKDTPLSKVNIIYGRNYSGKTTFSRIFECVSKGQLLENYKDSIFSITDVSGNQLTNSNLGSNYIVRVYNTDFVRDNLSWLHDDKNGEIKPFTLIGGGNISAQKRIDEIDKKLGSIEEEKGLYYIKEQKTKDVNRIKNNIEKIKKDIADLLTKQANGAIKVDKYFVEQGKNYNITTIRSEISEILKDNINYILDDASKEHHKKIIDEVEKLNINEIRVSSVNLSQFVNDTEKLISKKITITNTIEELLRDNLLHNWVEKGLEYHKGKRTTCAFCKSKISNERWKELEEHFSKESEELKKLLMSKIEDIENAKNRINDFLQNQDIKKEYFYTIFHEELESSLSNWGKVVSEYCIIADILIEKLKNRSNDIFYPKEFDEIEKKTIEKHSHIAEELVGILNSINSLIVKHNGKTKTLTSDKNNSRKLLRYSKIQSFLNEIDYEKKEEDITNESNKLTLQVAELDEKQKKIAIIEAEKKQKELEKNDEGEAAKKINEHLINFFGHDELSLEPEIIDEDDPKTNFTIKRGNDKAYNLSEGECSLISFCYFIAKMEDELKSNDNKKLIIYIDDPISSLDNNHIFFMFSLIETIIAKENKYGQLFISTHNLDFLKYIKRLTIPRNEKNEFLVSHYIIEKNNKFELSKSTIKSMPSYLKDYVTEYNFLFKEIYNIAKPFNGERHRCIENTYTQFYNLPNNMRKFLECYLFYRFPNTENPIKNLPLLFDNNIPALVNRVVNEFSHLSWGDRGTLVMDVEEAETVAKEILKTIYNKDLSHYNALCESINVINEIDFS